MAEAKRRLAAILSADVAGYSRLMGADERATMDRLNAYRDVFRAHVSDHDGRVVDTAGDSVLAVFDSVVESVQCAVDVQGELDQRNSDLPEDRRMRFRIGVNLGDIIEQADGTIYGDGVNVSARVESLAEPGGVSVSASAHEQVEAKIAVDFEYQGEQAVKNIARPIRIYRVVTGSRGAPSTKTAAPALPDKPSIAVLPFDNMSGDAEQEYFADGIAEDIITDLSKVSGLFVTARNTAFTYKGRTVNVPEVGRELGVRYVLEGSVRKAGNRVRITAQLIDSATGGHAWAERYDRDLADIFAVQDDVTSNIVAALKVTLTAQERQSLAVRHTENLEAYDCYLRALNCPPSDSGVERQRKHLEETIALDPGFARARALLANAYILAHQLGRDWGMDLIANARDQAQRALELNPSDGVAHYVMAHYYLFAREPERLAEEARRAIELNPNSATILADLGRILAFGTGRTEEGAEMAVRAMRLNPRYPDWYRWAPAFHYTMTGDHVQGAETFELIQEPALWRDFYLAINYARLGQEMKAKATRERALRNKPDLTVAWTVMGVPFHASLIDRIVDGAIAAGFPPGDIDSLRTNAR